MKADNGFQDNYSVVVASGTLIVLPPTLHPQTCPQQHLQPAGTRFYLHTHSVGHYSHTRLHCCFQA